jgi:hypothetical protein
LLGTFFSAVTELVVSPPSTNMGRSTCAWSSSSVATDAAVADPADYYATEESTTRRAESRIADCAASSDVPIEPRRGHRARARRNSRRNIERHRSRDVVLLVVVVLSALALILIASPTSTVVVFDGSSRRDDDDRDVDVDVDVEVPSMNVVSHTEDDEGRGGENDPAHVSGGNTGATEVHSRVSESAGTIFYCGVAYEELRGSEQYSRYSRFGLFLAKSLFPEFIVAAPLTKDSLTRATEGDLLIFHSHQYCEVSVNEFPGTQLHVNVSSALLTGGIYLSAFFDCRINHFAIALYCRLSIMTFTHRRKITLMGC